MTTRDALVARVAKELGARRLIWAGLRGSDAESLTDLPQFDACFSIIDGYERRPLEYAVAHERMSGRRPDMERWDIDDHLADPASQEFRRGLLRAMGVPSALIPYRPSRFLSSLWFARQDRCLNLGLFGAHQSAFEHKPWVESSLQALGVPGLGWRYVADEEQLTAQDQLEGGSVVLRRSRTSGGEGMVRVETAEEMMAQWPQVDESFVSIAPFISGGTPVNVGATVFHDGVSVHHASLQLIGVPSCTTRPFGYCGNDFGAASDLSDSVLDAVEEGTGIIGRWLGQHGYRGTFGVDFLVKDNVPLFTEINPRFQGSTAASSRLSVEQDLPCLLVEHLAAFLGMPRTQRPPLRTQVRSARDLAQVVVHWTGGGATRLNTGALANAARGVDAYADAEAVAPEDVAVHPGATVARLVTRSRLTTTGYDLAHAWDDAIRRWLQEAPAAPESEQ